MNRRGDRGMGIVDGLRLTGIDRCSRDVVFERVCICVVEPWIWVETWVET